MLSRLFTKPILFSTKDRNRYDILVTKVRINFMVHLNYPLTRAWIPT